MGQHKPHSASLNRIRQLWQRVTGRHGQADLREVESRYRQLVENVPVGIYRTTPGKDGRILMANQSFMAIFGIQSEAELKALRVADLYVDPADRQEFSDRVLAEGSLAGVELYLKRRDDGTPLWGRVTARVVRDDAGQVLHFDCALEDVTERKRTQEMIQRSREQRHALLEAVPDVIFQFDRAGVFTNYKAPEGGTFVPPEAFLGKSIRDVMPELADQTLELIGRTCATGELQTFEYQLPLDGELHDYEARMSASGQDEVVVVVRDITEWKRLTERLRHEHDRVARIAETSPVGITMVDREGQVVFANARAEAILGLTKNDIVQRTYNAPEWRITDFEGNPFPETQLPFAQVMRTGKPVYDVRHAIEWPDGRRVLLAINGAPLVDEDGDIQEVVLSIEDVTEQVQAEQVLRESENRYRSLFDNALTGFALHEIVTDETGRPVDYTFLEVNRAFERFTGLRAEDVVGKRISQVLPDIEPKFIETYGNVALTGQAIRFESYAEPLERHYDIAAFSPDVGLFATLFLDITARVRAEQAEREHHALSDALRETAAVLTRSLDMDEVLERILTSIGKVVPHDTANIMLVEGDTASVVRWRGYEAFNVEDIIGEVRLNMGEFPAFREMITTGQGQIFADTQTDHRWHVVAGMEWIRSHITVPILIEDRVAGVINLDSATPHAFVTDHLSRLHAFADQASIAIRNAELYAEIQQHVTQLEALHKTTLDVAAQIDLDTLLTKLVENALVLVGAEAGGIYLYRPDQDVLEWVVRVGEGLVPVGMQLQRGEGVAGKVWEQRETLIINDYSNWEGRAAQYEGYQFSEVMGVPITWDNQLLGVFMAVADAAERTFSQRDAQLLSLFVNQASIAIQKARLFDELESRVHDRTVDLRVRNRVASTLSHSLDRDAILNGVLETTVEQLRVSGGAIYLLDEARTALDLAASYGIEEDTLVSMTAIMPSVSSLTQGVSGAFTTVDMPYNGTVAAILWVPIWRQERIEGIIALVNREMHAWRSADAQMLDAIGRQIAVALNNTQLYAQAVRSEARVRTILHSVADGLLVFDQAGRLLLLNPAVEALFSFFPQANGGAVRAVELFGSWLHAQGDPQTLEFALPIAPLAGSGSVGWEEQCRVQPCVLHTSEDAAWPCWLRPGGLAHDELHQCAIYNRVPMCSIQAHSAEVRDAKEQVWGRVIVLRDVTYYRELDELKGLFVSTVSHELRTPLSVVLLQVSTLLRYYDRISDDQRRTMIGEVQTQAHILRDLIEDILELSRFDARRSLPEKQWFDLVTQCHEVVESLLPAIREKSLEVDLSQCSGLRYVFADSNQILRVLRNLVGNAVKYTPSGGRVKLALTESEGMVQLAVTDTGIGILPDEQLFVFDRFFRSETAAHMAPGTGLGLSITKEIVDMHAGRIELASVPGEGSTFTLFLPVGSEEE